MARKIRGTTPHRRAKSSRTFFNEQTNPLSPWVSPLAQLCDRKWSRPRVSAFLRLQSGPNSQKQKILTDLYGTDNVRSANLHTRWMLLGALLVFGAIVGTFIAITVVLFVKTPLWTALVGITIMIVVAWLIESFGGRGICGVITRRAAKSADEAFAAFRPNLIVASSFGAVVAMNMKSKKVPMLLFTPALGAYGRYMKSREIFSVSAYPYVIIVHPSNDKIIPLDDSIQLVETSDLGRTRLEVVEDGHNLATLTPEDIKDLVDEVFELGRTEVLSRMEDPYFDPTLFDSEDERMEEVRDEPAKAEEKLLKGSEKV